MAMDIYYLDDIRNAILVAEQAAVAAGKVGAVSTSYVQGYRAALLTLALAFGLQQRPEASVPSAWDGRTLS